MPATAPTAISVIGIDIGRTRFTSLGVIAMARLCCDRSGHGVRSRLNLPICRRAWSAWRPASAEAAA